LRQAAINKIVAGKRRRKRSFDFSDLHSFIMKGNRIVFPPLKSCLLSVIFSLGINKH
jgi:hypothetical protein